MRLSEKLSPKQQKVYDFIGAYNAEQKISPSIREIAFSLDLGDSTVNAHIQALKRKGYLTNIYGVPRSFRIVTPAISG